MKQSCCQTRTVYIIKTIKCAFCTSLFMNFCINLHTFFKSGVEACSNRNIACCVSSCAETRIWLTSALLNKNLAGPQHVDGQRNIILVLQDERCRRGLHKHCHFPLPPAPLFFSTLALAIQLPLQRLTRRNSRAGAARRVPVAVVRPASPGKSHNHIVRKKDVFSY